MVCLWSPKVDEHVTKVGRLLLVNISVVVVLLNFYKTYESELFNIVRDFKTCEDALFLFLVWPACIHVCIIVSKSFGFTATCLMPIK